MRIGQRAPPVAGVCVIGFREACAGFDGNHVATETRRPGVNDVNAPAPAGLCRSVGHEPLIAPPAGFERGGNPVILWIRAAEETGMGVMPEAHRPTGADPARSVPRGPGWRPGASRAVRRRQRAGLPPSRSHCRHYRSWFTGSGSRRRRVRRPSRFARTEISLSHRRQYIPIMLWPVDACNADSFPPGTNPVSVPSSTSSR